MHNNKLVLTNLLWRFAEQCGSQAASFFVSVVLARLLTPGDYGTVALMLVFINILNVFVDGGFSTALIQKKNADDLDFSTIFFFNLFSGGIAYLLLFAAAPWIASFYARPEMEAMIRVLGIHVLISGVKSVQVAYVSRNMIFKRFFFATLGGTVGAAILGISMAMFGLGAWAIIAQSLFNTAVDTAILWITVKWRPKAQFSFSRLQNLFCFGWKMLVSGLLNTGYENLRSLIIGKVYSSEDLAFYNKGNQIPSMVVNNVNVSIDSVLLPTLSAAQDNREAVKKMSRRSMQISTYVMAPLMVGVAVCATPLVRLLLTEKWLPCVPFIRIFCITYTFYPIHTANLNAIKALGRSDLFLKLEIQKKVVGILLLLTTMWFGVMAMAYSLLVSSFISQLINSWPNRKLLKYTYFQQLYDIAPSILLALAMGAIVFAVPLLGMGDLLTLVLQVALGGILYLAGSIVFRLEAFYYLLGVVKGFLHRA